MTENNDLVEQVLKATSEYASYQFTNEPLMEQFEKFKKHWAELKQTIEEQSNEWRTFHIETANEVSVKAHLLQNRFETELQEQQLLDDGGATSSAAEVSNTNEMEVDSDASKVLSEEQAELKKKSALSLSDGQVSVVAPKPGGNVQQPGEQSSKSKEPEFYMKDLESAMQVMQALQMLPRIPEEAEHTHIRALRTSLHALMQRFDGQILVLDHFAPMIIVQVVNVFNNTMSVVWNYKTAGKKVGLTELRNFLAEQQDMMGSGIKLASRQFAVPATNAYNRRGQVNDDASWADVCGASALPANKGQGAVPKKIFRSASVEKVAANLALASCLFCGKNHQLYRCPFFLDQPIPLRWGWVDHKKICPNCLKGYHDVERCGEKGCKKCVDEDGNPEKHNSVLCYQNKKSN